MASTSSKIPGSVPTESELLHVEKTIPVVPARHRQAVVLLDWPASDSISIAPKGTG